MVRERTLAKLIAGGGGNVIRFGGIILVREAPAPNDVLAGAAKYSGLPQLLERLLDLFVIFAGGKLLAEVAERLRQPSVIGEVCAGVLLGPSLLGLIHPNELTHGLAEVGAIFLLFTVGLEIKPRDLIQVGRTATAVATLGVLVPLIVGFFCMKMMGHGLIESIFVGAAMVATSVGITARSFRMRACCRRM